MHLGFRWAATSLSVRKVCVSMLSTADTNAFLASVLSPDWGPFFHTPRQVTMDVALCIFPVVFASSRWSTEVRHWIA